MKARTSENSTIVLWGYHPVREVLLAGRRTIYTLFVAEEKESRRGCELAELAGQRSIALQRVTAAVLTRMIGHSRHQGFAAAVGPYPFVALENILETPGNGAAPALLLVLDQVVDPQNLGAMARTAHCAGVQAMVIPRERSAPPSPAASKASAGALEHLPVVGDRNLASALKTLKALGVWVAGADRSGPDCLYDLDLTLPLAVVIGGEEKGIRPLVKKQCDFLVSIPQSGLIGSLNASAAAAVILYEVLRQRRAAGPGCKS